MTDPATWPALLHQWTRSWSSLVRLLVALTALTGLVTGALLLLGDVAVNVGPLGVERRSEVADVGDAGGFG